VSVDGSSLARRRGDDPAAATLDAGGEPARASALVRRVRRAVAIAAIGLAPGALAQGPRLEISLPAGPALAREGPLIRARNVISDSTMRRFLDNGFPARLHFRVELWSLGGLFNALRGSVEWDLIVRYDALGQRYRLVRVDGDEVTSAGQFASFADAVAEVERPTRAPLRARRQRDRQYFNALLEVQTLSANELDELQQWLSGELQPAVRGERNPGTAIGRGLRRLLARILGAERRNLQARSRTFQVPPS
jgi:hypothetical protein